jgi:two-component system chemotaxis response regulator CheB
LIRVLVAESSVVVRERFVEALAADPGIQIVGEARNGAEAVALTVQLRPDLVVMAIRMSKVDGFEATRRIMTEAPTPIVVAPDEVDARDVEVSMHALRAGALAVVPRPTGAASWKTSEAAAKLIATIKAMAEVKLVRRWPERLRSRFLPPQTKVAPLRRRVVAIAASTGGPAALQKVLGELPGDFPLPILIVQHISAGFIGGLVDWLNSTGTLKVKVAEDGEMLEPRKVYIAPDDRHLGVSARSAIALSASPPINGFRPSATFLFQTVADVFGASAVATILTGMGQDGVAGLRAIRQKGGLIVAQDEATSIVFGMPGAAVAAGLPDAVLPLPSIGPRLIEMANG